VARGKDPLILTVWKRSLFVTLVSGRLAATTEGHVPWWKTCWGALLRAVAERH
jgi:hypothetical protein